MLWLGLCLGVAAWCLLSLGLEKHHQQVFASAFNAGRARALRAGGWLLLAAVFALFVYRLGWAQGPIFWFAALIVSALAWTLLMTMAPKASIKVAAMVLLSGVASIPLWLG
ncbi:MULTISPECIES: DUF3325 domain-containing protein [Lysobacter]|jgi:hypothetical protein|uniref:DUF3325 domain-containing protein n=1 Tax=Lysobacter gummosus TaxID=262324 RepID=A0ABY3XBB9_9GAMM|nr:MULTISPECIES: DUF3325 domain-containing protein [Lysobacter]ALN92470.1 hypothetical protein LG3211_3525 [Lysobacter gummosus]UJB20639.1 DUF3325 domain-containing protein [Lysobacter capsici]UJQ30247.1 DUF3325 domain-containing protein [Lysobacter gummosus]UNP28047.1 DUF3325 domain-containing protein [Lysobacter gummosus]